MLARWTKPVALGYEHKSRSEAGAVPTFVARIAQKDPFGMIGLATLLTGVLVVGFFDVALSW